MTVLTNRYGLPAAYAQAVAAGQRSYGPRRISVTELLKPPQAFALERVHAAELTEDVADNLPQFFGTAIHAYLDRHGAGSFHEQTLQTEIDGWTVHGTPDALTWTGIQDGVLIDWKTTLCRSLQYERVEWEAQTNLYAHLVRLCGLPPVTSIVIWAFLRDWDSALLLSDPVYPRQGICKREIPLWDAARADAYLRERLRLHRAAQEDGERVLCTDDDRWIRTRWALVKAGNTKATRLFDTKDEACAFAEASVEELQDWRDWYAIESRVGLPLRCMKFCAAAPWCGQWQAEEAAMTLPQLMAVQG